VRSPYLKIDKQITDDHTATREPLDFSSYKDFFAIVSPWQLGNTIITNTIIISKICFDLALIDLTPKPVLRKRAVD